MEKEQAQAAVEGAAEPLSGRPLAQGVAGAGLDLQPQFRDVLDHMQLAVVGLDVDGRVTTANSYFLQLTGYTMAEIQDRDWFTTFIPPEERGALLNVFGAVVGEDAHQYHENAILTRIGERRMIAWYNGSLRGRDGQLAGSLSIGADVTDQRKAEAAVQAVNEVTGAILAGQDSSAVLDVIAQRARALTEADVATISVRREATDTMVIAAANGTRAESLLGMEFPHDRSISGNVLETGLPELVDDVSADPRAHQPIVAMGGIGPAMFVPLSASQNLGTLMVARVKGRPGFARERSHQLEVFAQQAALAIEFERVQARARDLMIVEDRERIGRELHDGVIQALFGVGLELEATASITRDDPLAKRLRKMIDEIDRAILDLRGYIFALRPGLLADRSLGQVLAGMGADVGLKSGVTIVVEVDPDVAAELTPIAGHVIQLVREALSNVAKHSGAATCRVALGREDGGALLVVDDDGRGFTPDQQQGSGQGLRNLRDRATVLGGSLDLISRPGSGTEVRLKLPLGPNRD